MLVLKQNNISLIICKEDNLRNHPSLREALQIQHTEENGVFLSHGGKSVSASVSFFKWTSESHI